MSGSVAAPAGSLPLRRWLSGTYQASFTRIVRDAPGSSVTGTNSDPPGAGWPSVTGGRATVAASVTAFHVSVSGSHQPPRNQA